MSLDADEDLIAALPKELRDLLEQSTPGFLGFSTGISYKKAILPWRRATRLAAKKVTDGYTLEHEVFLYSQQSFFIRLFTWLFNLNGVRGKARWDSYKDVAIAWLEVTKKLNDYNENASYNARDNALSALDCSLHHYQREIERSNIPSQWKRTFRKLYQSAFNQFSEKQQPFLRLKSMVSLDIKPREFEKILYYLGTLGLNQLPVELSSTSLRQQLRNIHPDKNHSNTLFSALSAAEYARLSATTVGQLRQDFDKAVQARAAWVNNKLFYLRKLLKKIADRNDVAVSNMAICLRLNLQYYPSDELQRYRAVNINEFQCGQSEYATASTNVNNIRQSVSRAVNAGTTQTTTSEASIATTPATLFHTSVSDTSPPAVKPVPALTFSPSP